MLTAGPAGPGPRGVTRDADRTAPRRDEDVAGARRAARCSGRGGAGAPGLGPHRPVPAALVADQRREQDPLADPLSAAPADRADRVPRGRTRATGDGGGDPLPRRRGASAAGGAARRDVRSGRRALRGTGARAARRSVLRPGRRARRRTQDLRRLGRARRPHAERAGRLRLRLPRAQRRRQDDHIAHPRRPRARGRRRRQDPGPGRRRRRSRRAQPDRLPPRRARLLQVDDGARVPALRRQPVRPLRQRAGQTRRRHARARRAERREHARRRVLTGHEAAPRRRPGAHPRPAAAAARRADERARPHRSPRRPRHGGLAARPHHGLLLHAHPRGRRAHLRHGRRHRPRQGRGRRPASTSCAAAEAA